MFTDNLKQQTWQPHTEDVPAPEVLKDLFEAEAVFKIRALNGYELATVKIAKNQNKQCGRLW